MPFMKQFWPHVRQECRVYAKIIRNCLYFEANKTNVENRSLFPLNIFICSPSIARHYFWTRCTYVIFSTYIWSQSSYEWWYVLWFLFKRNELFSAVSVVTLIQYFCHLKTTARWNPLLHFYIYYWYKKYLY